MLNAGVTTALDATDLEVLSGRVSRARRTALTAPTVAASGHPGGSLSSIHLYTLLYSCARLRPSEPRWGGRDRIVVSHGHTSPGVYGCLAEAGFFPAEQVEAHFRQSGSVFEGHVERSVPGVEWSSGNLGQGLSAGVGMALGARLTGGDWHTFVVMSDGEQHKGQVSEARRLAVKEELGSVTALVDWNHIQISGRTEDVMPVNLTEVWAADGWRVYDCDGHDLEALHAAVSEAVNDGVPSVVLAHTVIGKGVSFMEGVAEYHGRGLTADEYGRAAAELGFDPAAFEAALGERDKPCTVEPLEHLTPAVEISAGTPREYAVGTTADNRGAWGAALRDIADANAATALAVFDCDLSVSVKTDSFAEGHANRFIQTGVGEHNAATAAGALSTVPGAVAFWSDFGVFGVDEAYNQQRLNDINGAALKLVVTHCGLDVGEDGKTHQCLDYVGAFRDQFGWKVIVPADANQTDRVVRALPGIEGNVAVAMGRSKLGIIADEEGSPLFGGSYRFSYGEITWARSGEDGVMLVMGTPAGSAVAASDALRQEDGVRIAVGIVASPLALGDDALSAVASGPWILSLEDHGARGGLGGTIAEWLADRGCACPLRRVGVAAYQSSGTAADLYARVGLDRTGIIEQVRSLLRG